MHPERRRNNEEWTPQNVERPSRMPYRRTRDSGETDTIRRSTTPPEDRHHPPDDTDE